MNYKKLQGSVFVDVAESLLVEGDRIKREVVPGVWEESNYIASDNSLIERNWRDSELTSTDGMLQSDRPDLQDILSYRAELRDYPSQVDFPDGTRPEL